MRKYEFVERWKAAFPGIRRCCVLGVSPSGYWAWRRRAPSRRAAANAELQQRIVTIHTASRATDGALRIHAAVRAQGGRGGRQARLMRLAGGLDVADDAA
jgi:putative transposase